MRPYQIIFSILTFISRLQLVMLIDCDLSCSFSSFEYLIKLYKNELNYLVPKLLSYTSDAFLDVYNLKSTHLRESILNYTISNEYLAHFHKIAHTKDFNNMKMENTFFNLVLKIQLQYNHMERYNSKECLKDIREVDQDIIHEIKRILEQQKAPVKEFNKDINPTNLKKKIMKLDKYYFILKFLIKFESQNDKEEYEKFKLGSGVNLLFDNLHFS